MLKLSDQTRANYGDRVCLAALATLVLIWAVPHTMAIRNFAAIILLLTLILNFRWKSAPIRTSLQGLRWPLLFYFCLTLWLPIQAVSYANDLPDVWDEYRGQWLKGGMFLLMGGALGFYICAPARLRYTHRWLGVLVALLAVPVIATLLDILWLSYTSGEIVWSKARWTQGRTIMSIMSNILLVFLIADLLQRVNGWGTCLPWRASVSVALVAAAVLCVFLMRTRNTLLSTLLLLMSAAALLIFTQKKHLSKHTLLYLSLSSLLILSLFAYAMVKNDARWSKFLETVPIALDIDQHKAWIGGERYPLPRLSDGSIVDSSAYHRIAWVVAGGRFILQHPLGIGYSRNAFGKLVWYEYHDRSRPGRHAAANAHSSLLDLTLGSGIPGLVLWLLLIGSLLYYAWSQYFRKQNGYALTLALLVSGLFARSFVDSIFQDHFLQEYLFLIGLLAILSEQAKSGHLKSYQKTNAQTQISPHQGANKILSNRMVTP